MVMAFNITTAVKVKKDKEGVVRKIYHPKQAYKVEDTTVRLEGFREGELTSLRILADEYLRDVLSVFGLSDTMADDLAGEIGIEASDEGPKLRFFEMKEVRNQAKVSYAQTEQGLPVWQSGVGVKLANQPYRVIGSQNSVQNNIDVEPPQADAPYLPEYLDAEKLAELLALSQEQIPEINNIRLLIYRFDPDDRGNAVGEPEHGDETSMLTCGPNLQPPDVSPDLVPERYYVVSEVLFSFYERGFGNINWRAFIELQSGSVVRLDSFIGCIDGFVYLKDPLTKTGDTSIRADSPDATLDAHRDRVELHGLVASEPQELRGEYVHVCDLSAPGIQAPEVSRQGNFFYSVPTDHFSAVNAYHHCDRLFRMLHDMGFDVHNYFNGTTFPVPVDHRVSYKVSQFEPPTPNVVNASAPGDAQGDGSDGFRFALVQRDTSVGMAVEWRVVLHEFGHAILWDHLNSANFRFAHSPGDSLAAILNDPESQAPDRFDTFPWTPIRRRHNRRVEDGWGWGGNFDDPWPVGHPFSKDRAGYDREQILSSTLFRYYRAMGGDHSDPAIRTEASRYAAFIIFSAVGVLSSTAPPQDAEDFADELMDADLSTDEFEGMPGGTTHKVIRWAFERQGLYQPANAPTPTIQPGSPPEVDVYIDDGRQGGYDPQKHFVFSSQEIWNRLAADSQIEHQQPVAGQPNFIYVGVKNRGYAHADNVVVKAYATYDEGQRLWPDQWTALNPMPVPATDSIAPHGETIVGPIEWTPANKDSVALFASVSADGDASNADRVVQPIPVVRLTHCDNNTAGRIVSVTRSVGISELTVETQPQATIPDADPAGIVSELMVSNSGNIAKLNASVAILHTWIGDLEISLRSPSGTTIILFKGEGEPIENLITTFTPDTLGALEGFTDEDPLGVWRLRAIDHVGLDEGTLVRWGLEIQIS
jgi:subtilisin-like proprotein convertase family protein